MVDGISDDTPGLFGWVPRAPRGQGRPAFEWSREKSNRIMVLFAAGYRQKDVAAVIGCDVKTLRKVFSRECRDQEKADLVVRSGLMMRLVDEAEKGSVAAIKHLDTMIESERRRALGEKVKERGEKPKAKPAPVGKKQELLLAAENVGGKFAPRKPPPGLMN